MKGERKKLLKAAVVSIFVFITLFFTITKSYASESEVILKMLLKKGIITQQEYDQVMSEVSQKGASEEAKPKAAEAVEKHEGASPAKWVENIQIGGSVTMLGQGTSGNEDNNPPGKDTTNASLRGNLEITTPIVEQGEAFMNLRGGVGKGLVDDEKVTSFTGVDALSGDSDGYLEINEAWYEHTFMNDKLKFTIGKVDLTAYFDGNDVANDEEIQFLSDGFVNNIAIEFPDNTIGTRLTLSPNELLDVSLGWQPGSGEWENIFSRPFIIGEIDVKPTFGELSGNYRLYAWTNRTDHEVIADDMSAQSASLSAMKKRMAYTRQDEDASDTDSNGWGVGTSIDQQVARFLKIFGRLGYQNEDVYPFDIAWSAGFNLKGSIWHRENDEFALAYGIAHLSSDYKNYLTAGDINAKDEKHLEMYYNVSVNDHITISPDIQLLMDPEGIGDKEDIWLFALRVHIMTMDWAEHRAWRQE
ncbi:carbohydrate-selective porin OprB [Candidatus Magnetoovum chiemensis]|nr:carbohydrate-selective porin OprB [Candidatus Magnetoovum chiemensis]